MYARRNALLAIFLLLISAWSGSAVAEMESPESAGLEAPSSESAGQWSLLSHADSYEYQIRESSDLIFSPFGNFDPYKESIPMGPDWLRNSANPGLSPILVVQSVDSDLTPLINQLEISGFRILDFIPDSSLIVRAPSDSDYQGELDKISHVRWSSVMPISWKVSPEVLASNPSDTLLDLEIIPTSDLDAEQLSELSWHLSQISEDYGNSEVCDWSLCQLRAVDPIWIAPIAMDWRVLSIQKYGEMAIHNTNAWTISGLEGAYLSSSNTLNGSGEVLAISDTGLDEDHGDFNGRVRGIYDQFGPDNSHSDMNSGHGTHVAATLLGDGSGDPGSTGMVPDATFHFYQLEADNSGLLARWGSLYEMFTHSWDQGARIQTNSWGNTNLVGEYSSDSRSVDDFIYDYPRFLALFSAGDLGPAVNSVTPPGTAKNALTVGASTTGAYSSVPEGSVSETSSSGTTLDGRIKPDIVAPGVMICSARAEEAQYASGSSCSSSTHSDGTTPLYMTLNGSSMATPVAAGAAAMTRQYLRESEGISEPRSDLIRAILINGAEDIGNPDIPNALEGWGQLDLQQSLYPSGSFNDGSEGSLNLFYDDSRQLLPGHSFVYTFEMSSDAMGGLDITLVWNDREGSAIANQSAPRLVNDLDLRLTAPNGSVYIGNSFSGGFSIMGGGNEDRLNNVERIRLPSGDSDVIEMWTVEVGHAGGYLQDYSLVVTASALEVEKADLAVFEGSLTTSIESPLQGDTLLIEAAWGNRASAPTGSYNIEIEDLTTGNIIHTSTRASLNGGELDSYSFPHSFSSTGEHLLELRLDSDSVVEEINDEISGIDNNKIVISVSVSQIGVRVTPMMEDGSFPSNPAQLNQAMSRTLDPRTGSSIYFDLELRNEGTSPISVRLSVSPVQIVSESGILQQPTDEWWKLLNESGPWELAPFGEEGDRILVQLNLTDVDTDIDNPSGAVYALPGTFVTDLNLYDVNAPTVSNSMRLEAEVERVEGLYTIAAGTEELGAEPGELAIFSLSVKNTGNGPTQYRVTCESENQWTIFIGNSQSSDITLDPLGRLQFLPIPIQVRVPDSQNGEPSAGTTEDLSCTTTSVNDPTLSTTEDATVEVLENMDFLTDIFSVDESDSWTPLGPLAAASDRAVLNGDTVATKMVVSNDGNVPMSFEVTALSSLNTWPVQIVHDSEESLEGVSFTIPAGSQAIVTVNTIVPMTAQMGDSNTITIRTTQEGGEMVTNATKLVVMELAHLDLIGDDKISVALGTSGVASIHAHNIGNVELSVSLTMGTLPEGWSAGFLSSRDFQMGMNQEATIMVALELPGNLSSGSLASTVPVIIEAVTPSGISQSYTVWMQVEVLPSSWLMFECQSTLLEGIVAGSEGEFEVTLTNWGNVESEFTIDLIAPDGWSVFIYSSHSGPLSPGQTIQILVTVSPGDSTEFGLVQLSLHANSTSSDVTSTNGNIDLQVSKSRDSDSGFIPPWAYAVIFLVLLSSSVVMGLRMRKSTNEGLRPEEELIPPGSALLSGTQTERMAAAMETSVSGEVLTGTVSDDEIKSALSSSSLPSLEIPSPPDGAPPLPLGGLPEGWTIDQWVAYGHLWWEQNRP